MWQLQDGLHAFLVMIDRVSGLLKVDTSDKSATVT
jgi:hypothetical protein